MKVFAPLTPALSPRLAWGEGVRGTIAPYSPFPTRNKCDAILRTEYA